MYSLALLGFGSFVLSLVLTPLVRNLARRWGLVDKPDGERRVHADPVPRLGGVPIALSYLGAFGTLFLLSFKAGAIVGEGLPFALRLVPAVGVVFLTGLVDDLRGLSPTMKLAGQAAGATIAIWAGIDVASFGGIPLPQWIGAPITLLWLVGCANAFNLIDGVDGLSAGLGLFATLTMLMASLLQDNVALAMATIPLAGALLGFLRYNFNPATIFLGDCGSLLVGFLLGCFGVVWSQKSATMLGMTAPLIALAIPLLDTTLSIARRFLSGKSIFEGDRRHIHHRLLDRGFTPRKVVLLLYASAGLGAGLSIIQSTAHNRFGGLVILLFCTATWIGVQHLGYAEFGVARQMVVQGVFRRHLSNELALRSFEESLSTAESAEERWQTVVDACRRFGFSYAEMRLNATSFTETITETHGSATWDIRIPLSTDGYVYLQHCFGDAAAPAVVVPLANSLRSNLFSSSAERMSQPGSADPLATAGSRSAAVGA
jgi:UDP-GlcNAc:undecaprenyl-phosphate/decaprenyl-phosphate GlcNAc-1-phosphate transferase